VSTSGAGSADATVIVGAVDGDPTDGTDAEDDATLLDDHGVSIASSVALGSADSGPDDGG
jgi:hypothetical protein